MTIRTQRRLYWITAALFAAGSAVVWSRLFQSPDPHTDLSSGGTTLIADSNSDTLAAPELLPRLAAFKPYWEQPLRAPLYDPPPPPPPVVEPPPPLKLKLLGTVVEADRSEAILVTAAGNVEMHRAGATVDEALIQDIQDGSITVLYRDQTLTLTPAPGPPPGN